MPIRDINLAPGFELLQTKNPEQSSLLVSPRLYLYATAELSVGSGTTAIQTVGIPFPAMTEEDALVLDLAQASLSSPNAGNNLGYSAGLTLTHAIDTPPPVVPDAAAIVPLGLSVATQSAIAGIEQQILRGEMPPMLLSDLIALARIAGINQDPATWWYIYQINATSFASSGTIDATMYLRIMYRIVKGLQR